jgi:hypothetical protein
LVAYKGYVTRNFANITQMEMATVRDDGRTICHFGYRVFRAFANARKKASARPARWRGGARCVIADCPWSAGNLSSLWLAFPPI